LKAFHCQKIKRNDPGYQAGMKRRKEIKKIRREMRNGRR